MHPIRRRKTHVLWFVAIIPTDIGIGVPVRIVQSIAGAPLGTQALLVNPSIVHLATIGLLCIKIVHRVVSHVCGLIPVVKATIIITIPVWVPQTSSTNTPEETHASLVVPSKVRRAALIETRIEVTTWVGVHVIWMVAIIQTAYI